MKKVIVLLLVMVATCITFAQKPTTVKKPLSKSVKSNKITTPPPKIKMVFASRIGGGDITVSSLKAILDSSVIFIDEKGKRYTAKIMNVFYRAKNVFIDDQTEEKRVTYEYQTDKITNSNRLSDIWISALKQRLEPGDEFGFNEILVDTGNGYSVQVKGFSFRVK
jgi:hypothetical protein